MDEQNVCDRTWFKELRQEAGLTQLGLAKALNVSERAVQQWEAGERTPSRKRLKALAALLGAAVHDNLRLEVA